MTVQEKKDGLHLITALADENTKAVILRAFSDHLTELVVRMLGPIPSDEEATAIRHEAIGVIHAIQRMGELKDAAIEAAITRATRKTVTEVVGTN